MDGSKNKEQRHDAMQGTAAAEQNMHSEADEAGVSAIIGADVEQDNMLVDEIDIESARRMWHGKRKDIKQLMALSCGDHVKSSEIKNGSWQKLLMAANHLNAAWPMYFGKLPSNVDKKRVKKSEIQDGIYKGYCRWQSRGCPAPIQSW